MMHLYKVDQQYLVDDLRADKHVLGHDTSCTLTWLFVKTVLLHDTRGSKPQV